MLTRMLLHVIAPALNVHETADTASFLNGCRRVEHVQDFPIVSLSNFSYTLLDPVTVLDEADKWNKLWEELFLRK